jgi:ribosomal-protein-alanine N-acetyltransferase
MSATIRLLVTPPADSVRPRVRSAPRYVQEVRHGSRTVLPTIRTERLVLRDWGDGDLEPFAALNADAEVMEHFPSTLTRAESDDLVERIRHQAVDAGFSLWAVEVADPEPSRPGPADPGPSDGRPGSTWRTGFAGFTGIIRPPFVVSGRIDAGTVEIGWRLARWAWGRGLATEAASAVLGAAFTEFGLEEVVSFTVADNLRSQAVVQRIGLRRAPDRDFDHPRWEPSWGEGLRRHLVWSIDRAVWERQHAEAEPHWAPSMFDRQDRFDA